MEEALTDTKENFQDKEDLRLSLDKDISVAEDNDLMFSASKLKMVLERVQDQPLTLETEQQRTNQRCQESYLQNQRDRELRINKYVNFVGLNENLAQSCLDLVEIRALDSLRIFCREASATPNNFPVNLRSSKLEILFDSLKPHRRRRRSTSDLGMFFTESPFAAAPGNAIFSPVGQGFFDTVDRNNKVRNIMKNPLLRHLGALDGIVNIGRANSSVDKDLKCSEFISSPLGKSISSPQKRVRDITPLRRQRYGSEITDKMLISCSSTNSSSSYQSSSACGSASTGLLHCIWKNGLPFFMFSVDDQGDFYVASPCKVESSPDKALDYIYLFHSRMDDKKEFCADKLSGLVGKMKVSSSLTLNSDNVKLMETEFVLFGASEDGLGEIQSSTHMLRRKKGLPKKVVDMFRTNHSSKHKSTYKFGNPRFLSGDFSQGPCLDTLDKLDELGKVNLIENYLPPNLELAAIVVKDYHHDNTQEAAVGGWGLKFLKKVTMEHANISLHSSSGSCQDGFLRKSRHVKSLNVLVPAGLHGGPKTRNGGPSSLTERWRSGGHCDCGGWDTGCPLTVLNSTSSNEESSPETDAHEGCNSFYLFIEGAKEGEPTLKMVNVHEGLYFIDFQSTLSALQCFSIGVATIHSRHPSLCPKLHRR